MDPNKTVFWTLTSHGEDMPDPIRDLVLSVAKRYLVKKGTAVLPMITTFDDDEVADDEDLSQYVFERTGVVTQWRSDHLWDIVPTGEEDAGTSLPTEPTRVKKPLSCDKCGATFTNKYAKYDHKRRGKCSGTK